MNQMSKKSPRYIVMAALVLLAACCPAPEPTATPQPTEPLPEPQPLAADLTGGGPEILTWWTADPQAEGMNALYQQASGRLPGPGEVTQARDARHADELLATQMQTGDPPDVFQVRPGRGFIDAWVAEGQVEPVTFIFAEQGWMSAYPPGVIDILSHEGEVWSVPLTVRRSNVLWYNARVFEQAGVAPPHDLEEFFDVGYPMRSYGSLSAGMYPEEPGDDDAQATAHLFETLLLATMGPQGYRGLWDGSTDWSGAQVQEALETYARLLEYVGEDSAELTWQQAAQRVADGEAAMIIMDDRVAGYFESLGLTLGEDIGWVVAPGTEGTFVLLSDAFALPKGAPNRESAIAWLAACGSREGQDAFNSRAGTIPARTDADRSLYDAYRQSAMDDLASAEIVPGLAVAASAEWVGAIGEIVARFAADLDVAAAQEGLVQACRDAGVCR